MFFKTGKSSKEVGFLSPEMEPFVAQCRKQNALWFALAEDINRTAQATLTTYQIGPEISAQHLFGLLLLIRTLSNFQGGLLMAERGMVVEVRTLFRCCFENAFWLGALLKGPRRHLLRTDGADRCDDRHDHHQGGDLPVAPLYGFMTDAAAISVANAR